MKTRRFRLTKPAKILSLILIIAVVIGGVFAGVKTGVVKTSGSGVIGSLKNGKTGKVKADKNGNVIIKIMQAKLWWVHRRRKYREIREKNHEEIRIWS